MQELDMQQLNEKIKQACGEDMRSLIEANERLNANPFKQMVSGFNSPMRWTYVQVMFFSALAFVVMLYGIYRFYHEQDPKALMGWGIVIIMSGLVSQIGKMWYSSEMGRNRVVREIKLLELQLAHQFTSDNSREDKSSPWPGLSRNHGSSAGN